MSIKTADSDATTWLTSTDAARIAKVSDQTIRDWVRAGRLPCVYTANGMRLFIKSDVLKAAKTKRRQRHGDQV